MEQITRDHTRFASKRLFGAQYRLELLATISDGDAFFLTELCQRLGTPPSVSSVQKELKVMVSVGLLEEQSQIGGMREVYYRALPSPMWEAARLFASDIRAGAVSTLAQANSRSSR